MSWLPHVVTVAPASEPVTLAEAKTHCRVDGSDSDAELNAMVVAARSFVEEYTGSKLVSQTVSLKCSDWCDLKSLPIGPIQSVTSVKYLDSDGAEQTLSTDVYELVNTGLRAEIRLKVNQSFPSIRAASDAIRVVAVAGYSSLPSSIHHALLLLVGSWFDSRAVGEISTGAEALLTNHRIF